MQSSSVQPHLSLFKWLTNSRIQVDMAKRLSCIPIYTRHGQNFKHTHPRLTRPLVTRSGRSSLGFFAAYPSHREILDILDSSKGVPLFCDQSSIMSRRQIDGQDAQDKARFFEMLSWKTHPVLIAKQMLTSPHF